MAKVKRMGNAQSSKETTGKALLGGAKVPGLNKNINRPDKKKK